MFLVACGTADETYLHGPTLVILKITLKIKRKLPSNSAYSYDRLNEG
jgi:hypothetical protein